MPPSPPVSSPPAPLDHKVLTSGADTTPSYLATKLAAGLGVALTIVNPGANETLQVDSTALAGWATCRYYFIDYDAGNDANLGYIDASAGSSFTGGQTAAVAIKTIERLRQILPQNLNGASVVILQKKRAAGATYLKQDGITLDYIDTSPYVGYRVFLWRGSTDLSNDAADQVTCGFINGVTGPGGSGEFTVAGGATTTTVPIAAGSIAAEASTQYRIRFLPTTTTVALRNVCRVVQSNVVDTSVTVFAALPATPAAGDVFVIEKPGVRVDTMTIVSAPNGGTAASNFFVSQTIVGIAAVTTQSGGVSIGGSRVTLCGIDLPTVSSNLVTSAIGLNTLTATESYTNEAGNSITLGFNYRTQSRWSLSTISTLTWQFGQMNAGSSSVSSVGNGVIGVKSYMIGGCSLTTCGAYGVMARTTSPFNSGFIFGDLSTANGQPRLVASGSNKITFTSCGSHAIARWNLEGWTSAGINVFNESSTSSGVAGPTITIDGLSGTVSAANIMDMRRAFNTTLIVGTNIAITATSTQPNADDLLIGNGVGTGVGVTFADLANVGFRDPQGNTIVGTAGLTSTGDTIAMTNNTGGTVTAGTVVRISGVSAFAKADASASGTSQIDGITLTSNLSGTLCMVAPPTGYPYVQVDGSVTAGNLLYLSPTTPGKLTSTVPAVAGTNQKLRAGRAVTSNSTAIRAMIRAELISSTSDGVAP